MKNALENGKDRGHGLQRKILILNLVLLLILVGDLFRMLPIRHDRDSQQKKYLTLREGDILSFQDVPQSSVGGKLTQAPYKSFFFFEKLSINHASKEELMLVSGIGPFLGRQDP